MSTTLNPTHSSAPGNARTSASTNHAHPEYSPNGNSHHHHDTGIGGKKGKQKKASDPTEDAKMIQAKIAQLELDAAEGKDQEAEIEREVKKANRELNTSMSKMDELQKIDVLQKRVTEHLADMKRLERENQKNKKRGDNLQKEKDHGRAELSKSVQLKEKLEKLCRELQKENNRLKGENKALLDSEKKNREAWDLKFKEMLWQLQDYQEDKENPQAQVVNIEVEELFRLKFKSFIEQYELRELHFHAQMRTKEIEVQYHAGKFEEKRKAAEAEIARSRALNAQVLTFSKTEMELRNQLNIYVEKFKQVEDTLNNSNDLFLTFRKEMEEMSKKTKRLEKENLTLNRKHDATNRNIIELAEERNKYQLELDTEKKKGAKLTSIINQMQKQGRGVSGNMAMVEGGIGEYAEGDEGTESEYEEGDEYEEGEEDEGESEGEYDEDTEDELLQDPIEPFGPVPPPPPPPATNGVYVAATNGVNH
ncbi:myosin-like coiled-coil protein-domain-containing protein [Calycina marina]|uniref:Myosin-like coiled-coil protein-domain-containing protein n=1 Tax=Calycina marina TaxID=1763456 RepID=A0A9P7YX60_9HELO|nr:myosin-like coiled-coil protein-domain-containing protein [Calycina marina]